MPRAVTLDVAATPDPAPETLPAGQLLLGHPEPRVGTTPLRTLTRETSLGYQVCDFAERIGWPLLPWQREVVTRGLELLPDGSLRFRVVLVLVARQNGKSHLSRMLSLWRLFARGAELVLGAAQDVETAREHWEKTLELAERVPALAAGVVAVRRANGQITLKVARKFGGGSYKITATNSTAGRGKTVDHLTFDEIRTQRDMAAWSSLRPTITAREEGQIWAISNAGDDQSVVLNQLREAALTGRDESICLLEYSAPEECELDDIEGWRHANPAMGHIKSVERDLRSRMTTDPPAVFRTESLCQRVEQLDGAIDLRAWKDCADPAGSLAAHRDRLVLAVDVAPDSAHVSAVIAAELPDGRVRVEMAGAWTSVSEALSGLRDAVPRIAPVRAVWFPSGPAAAIGADLRGLFSEDQIYALTGTEVAEACMALAAAVAGGRLLHPGDPMLDAHVGGAHKMRQGDAWRFMRAGSAHVDGAYALAGAVHGVRTMPVEEVPVEPMVLAAW